MSAKVRFADCRSLGDVWRKTDGLSWAFRLKVIGLN